MTFYNKEMEKVRKFRKTFVRTIPVELYTTMAKSVIAAAFEQ
jgi:hypothetical protein